MHVTLLYYMGDEKDFSKGIFVVKVLFFGFVLSYGMYFGNSLLTEVVAQFCKAKFYFQLCAAVLGCFIL